MRANKSLERDRDVAAAAPCSQWTVCSPAWSGKRGRPGSDMTSSLKQFKRRALSRPEVRAAYDASADEFAFLDEVLKARAEAGLTQAEVADRIGTTQSAIARLESAQAKHSPSIATLQKYAKALGYTVQVKLVKERRLTTRSNGPGKTAARSGAHEK